MFRSSRRGRGKGVGKAPTCLGRTPLFLFLLFLYWGVGGREGGGRRGYVTSWCAFDQTAKSARAQSWWCMQLRYHRTACSAVLHFIVLVSAYMWPSVHLVCLSFWLTVFVCLSVSACLSLCLFAPRFACFHLLSVCHRIERRDGSGVFRERKRHRGCLRPDHPGRYEGGQAVSQP